ncbi:MAG: CDP-alcohol phosphatidyltransferase family protein [Cyanobacteria bacterium P01_F01_bin.150]
MISPILRQLDVPNLFTLTGLIASLGCAILAVQGHFYAAVICMMGSGLVDMLDGVLARRMKRSPLQSEVGKQLDTIVDVCSFGFTPAIFAYCFGLNDLISLVLLTFYISMTALRLAYFNSTGLLAGDDNAQKEYFMGLPVTYSALFIPSVFTINSITSPPTMKWILGGVYALLAIAMVANFRMLKLRGLWYGFFGLGAVVLIGFYSWMIIVE